MPNIVEKALEQEWKFRSATQQELLEFKREIKNCISFQKHEDKKDFIIKKLQTDKRLIQALNNSLANFSAGIDATWALKTNKMLEIIDGALQFINDHFAPFLKSIEDDSELEGYRVKTNKDDITIMDNSGTSLYGSSKSSFFKAVLINTYLVYSGKKYLSDIKLTTHGDCWIDQSPNAHVTPFPNDLNPEDIKNEGLEFMQCTYFYRDDKLTKGFAFIHSGYAFGGYRNETRYPYEPQKQLFGKVNAPEDCSSFIGKLTLEVDGLSTIDLWNRWKYQREGYSLDPEWKKTQLGEFCIKHYVPIESDAIKTGNIWASRSFNTKVDPEMKGAGTSGHMALVIDEKPDENQKIKTLGYNRYMPHIEGFGLQSLSSYPEKANQRIFFFSLKNSLSEKSVKSPPEPMPPGV